MCRYVCCWHKGICWVCLWEMYSKQFRILTVRASFLWGRMRELPAPVIDFSTWNFWKRVFIFWHVKWRVFLNNYFPSPPKKILFIFPYLKNLKYNPCRTICEKILRDYLNRSSKILGRVWCLKRHTVCI